MNEIIGKAKGGKARADSLSPEQRKEIAKKAASARWDRAIPKAEYVGVIKVGQIEIPCAVLEDGKRVVAQREVVFLLTGNRKGGLDRYLSAKNLLPYAPKKFSIESLDQTSCVYEVQGKKAHGYEGEDIIDICKMYLDARKQKNVLLAAQMHLADRAEFIVTSFAKVGITALIDEATGYQQIRAKDALQAYLEKVIRKELAAWIKRFPEEFYQQMYRLKKWPWTGTSTRRPQVAAKYTNNIVYARLGPGILDELKRINPKNEKGVRKAKHHQWLTDDVGHPQLAQHLYATIGLMRISETWDQFMDMLNRAYPIKDEKQLSLF